MSRVYLDLADTITLVNSGLDSAKATQVGADPVWEDDSDATYVQLQGRYFGPSEPQFFSRASVNFPFQEPAGLDPANPEFKCFIAMRLNALEAGLPFPSTRIEFQTSSPGLSMVTTPACPTSPEWVTVEMDGVGKTDLWFQPEVFRIQTQAAPLNPVPDGVRTWRIYEVRVYFEIAHAIISSRRKYPRDDGLGRGPRRIYPQPSSRTRGRHGPESYI